MEQFKDLKCILLLNFFLEKIELGMKTPHSLIRKDTSFLHTLHGSS